MISTNFAYKCTLLVGLFDKDTKKQEILTETAEQLIAGYFTRHGRCCTLSRCTGVYRHNDGATVCEPSIRVEWFLTEEDAKRGHIEGAYDFCPVGVIGVLGAYLNQESILYHTEPTPYAGLYELSK